MKILTPLLALLSATALALTTSAQTAEQGQQTNKGTTAAATEPADGAGNSSLPKPATKGGKGVKPTPGGAAALTQQDRDFIMKAAEGNTHEIEMGEMGQKQAQSAEVKEYARRMVQDHSQAGQRLMALATAKGIKPPKHGKQHSKVGGANFDQEFMAMMVQDHETTVQEFQKEANGGGDPEVRAFAKQSLRTLQEHLTLAKRIAGKSR
jgi:putative membrane protein